MNENKHDPSSSENNSDEKYRGFSVVSVKAILSLYDLSKLSDDLNPLKDTYWKSKGFDEIPENWIELYEKFENVAIYTGECNFPF